MQTIRSNQNDNFYLSEHDIYGSSRLGIRQYYPNQHYYFRDYSLSQTSPAIDDKLSSYQPWYSAAISDMITGSFSTPTPWGNQHELNLLPITHLLGQKGYELTNHLGNVQVVVSDKRINRDTAGTGAVTRYSPSILSAYDYYPYGMLMPGRYVQDTSEHCIAVVKNNWVTEQHPVDLYGVGVGNGFRLCAGNNCGFTAVEGGDIEVSTDDHGYLTIEPDGENSGAEQVFSLDADKEYTFNIDVASLEGNTYTAAIEHEVAPGEWEPIVSREITVAQEYALEFSTEGKNEASMRLRLMRITGGSGYLRVARIFPTTYSDLPKYYTFNICNRPRDNYSYGFNGQLKVNELNGVGNHNTALFWEYDTRTGRRWNIDPIDQISISNYAAFGVVYQIC